MRRAFALALGIGCSSCSPRGAAPPPAAGAVDAAGPAWLGVASGAPRPLVDRALAERARGGARDTAAVDAVLDRAAAQPASADGLRAAARLLEEHAGAGADPSWAGSGMSPAASLLHHGGVAVLAALAARACAAHPGDATVRAAIEEIPLPRFLDGGGHPEPAAARDRDDLRASAARCQGV